MTRLDKLPSQAIISSMKGKIDYYLWKGMPCARIWPVWKEKERSPAVKEANATFRYVMKLAPLVPEYVKDAYKRQVQGTPLRWQDLLVRGYISGIRY